MRIIEDVTNPNGKRATGVETIPEDVYRSANRLNPSSLAAGLMTNGEVDPSSIRRAYEHGDFKRTAAQQDRLDRGTLAHLMILQPELVASRVAVWNGDRRAGKEWDEFINANEGKLLIRAEDYREVKMACDQALSVPRVRQMCGGVDVEVAIYGEEAGLFTKGRVDALRLGELPAILDLKTTEAGIDWLSVQRTIRDFHYREKMAMYRRMASQATSIDAESFACFNIFVKLPPPVSVRIVKFTSGALEFGWMRMEKAIERVRACIAANDWPVFVAEDMADVAAWEIPEEEVEVEYQ